MYSLRTASVAACLTILSLRSQFHGELVRVFVWLGKWLARYTATGVVSSVSAADYLKCSPMFAGIESVLSSASG